MALRSAPKFLSIAPRLLQMPTAVSGAVPVRHHVGYISPEGDQRREVTTEQRTRKQLGLVNLKPIRKIQFVLDPLHPKVHSIRHFMTLFSNEKIRATNPKCFVKTDLKCDRAEPLMNVDLEEGNHRIIFKTANMNVEDLLTQFNRIVLPFVKVEPAVVVQTKAAKVGKK